MEAESIEEIKPRGSIDNVPQGYSMLKQYGLDWGYGVNEGSVFTRRKDHCVASKLDVRDFADHFTMGKASIQQLHADEYGGGVDLELESETGSPSGTPSGTPPATPNETPSETPASKFSGSTEARTPEMSSIAQGLQYARRSLFGAPAAPPRDSPLVAHGQPAGMTWQAFQTHNAGRFDRAAMSAAWAGYKSGRK